MNEGEDADEQSKVKTKFKQIYLPLETHNTNLIKAYLLDTKAKSLTMHKFNMDAEKDENNELQFDKDRIAMKLTEIINMISNYSKEMYAYNNSNELIKLPSLVDNKMNDTSI